jgi:hypothetical protein
MITFILEWVGTFLIIAGLFLLACKKASCPKTRMKGLLITITGCMILGIFALVVEAYGVLVTQIGVILVNSWGVYNCKREIKNELYTKN